jgi:16S rRNA G966 N2-methylase RsmD
VLDGFAGTGAVGIEALSRGASHVTFVERDPRAARLIDKNVGSLGAQERRAIIRAEIAAAVRRLAAERAWRESALREAALRPSRLSAPFTARERRVEVRLPVPLCPLR